MNKRPLINNRQSRKRPYELNPDTAAGFEFAVETNQTMMALQYAQIIIKDLLERVAVLESEKPESAAAAKSPTRRQPKKVENESDSE